MKEFAKRLQQIFDYYDINASSFADKIEVGRASISHLLSGRNKPSLDFVMRVVKTFPEVELYWLLNGKGSFPANSKAEPIPKSTSSNPEQKKQTETTKISKDHVRANPSDIERVIIFYKNGSFKTYIPE